MARDKEAFLSRWSRLKQERPKPAEGEKKEDAPPAALPPVESLGPESDEFKAFMRPKVKDALRRAALKKLFGDPHFNVPDPFEPFSGDWTVGEAIPQDMLASLNQAKEVLFREEEEEKKRLADQEKLAEKEETKAPDESPKQDA